MARTPVLLLSWWFVAVCFVGLAELSGWLGIDQLSGALFAAAVALVAISWIATDGGRSPVFLFLAFATLFLLGRAAPPLFGLPTLLDDVQFGPGVRVSRETVRLYGLLLLSSMAAIQLASMVFRARGLPQGTPRERQDVPAVVYLIVFIAFLPLYLYKNIYYFKYLLENGGYLAIYLGSEHLEGVGFLPRISSLVCLSAFSLYFFHESDAKRARRALILFIIVFSTELLVGLRGKFLVTALVFLLFYKLRFGGRFSLRGLALLALAVTVLAVGVEVFREQKAESTIEGNLFLGFLTQQGVSGGVPLLVIEYESQFARHAFDYLIRQTVVPFINQQDVPLGWALANDVSYFIQPEAYLAGFGTGSSYVAELYLLGGIGGAIVASALIGAALEWLASRNDGVAGALSLWILAGFVYYPRTMLHDPLHNVLRYGIVILGVAFACAVVYRWLVPVRRVPS